MKRVAYLHAQLGWCRIAAGRTELIGGGAVISVVFVIGILNLTLGFALAMLLEHRVVVPFPHLRRGRREEEIIFEIPVIPAVSPEVLREALPSRWLDMLDTSETTFSSFVEAAVEVLKLEIDTYREDLLNIEDQLRSALATKMPDEAAEALRMLVALNEEWVDRQNEVLRTMNESRDKLGQYASVGNQVETVLLDQTSLIEAECVRLKHLNVKDASESAAIINGVCHFVSMAHELRDAMKNATLLIVCNEGRLEATERRFRNDELTGLQNRIGVEMIFQNWWRQDKERQRLVCAALIDIDRFGELNNQVGTRVGDRFLKTLASYLEQLTASDSGLERVFRFSGQRFFVFFGDSGPRSVASNIEKVRQTIEAAKLEYNGQQYSLTVRSGVTEVRRDDSTATLFARLEELTETAKHAGRNRTGLGDSAGSGIIQPEPQGIKPRVIKVG